MGHEPRGEGMVDDGIRCAVCRTVSFEETALHSIDCPRHDFETCETCCTTHEESAALRARLALVERYVVKLEGLMGRRMSKQTLVALKAFVGHWASGQLGQSHGGDKTA